MERAKTHQEELRSVEGDVLRQLSDGGNVTDDHLESMLLRGCSYSERADDDVASGT